MRGKKGMYVISRRDFIKMSLASAAALGFSPLINWPKLAEAAADKKPGVVWLEGQDCAGCTESVISLWDVATIGKGRHAEQVNLADAILDQICIRYHETIMAGSGDVAEFALDEAIDEGGYVLVVEGSLPGLNPAFLQVAGHDLETKLVDAANAAAAIVAIGACATYGGIPNAGSTEAGQDTQGEGVDFFRTKHGITTPLINVPGCPVHPVWFWDTVFDFLLGNPMPLDPDLRPSKHFGATVHATCPRKKWFTQGKFLLDWNDKTQAKYCLWYKGCKGPWTSADCNIIKWNDGASCCIDNNAPCAGCTERCFYDGMSPLFNNDGKDMTEEMY